MNISAISWRWILICSGVLLLLMMLAFPFGYDQAAFMIGGEMTIKPGAIPYRDFLDTKPPVIFIIYGLASLLFGHHEWSIRAFDILFQIGTLLYFFKILSRISGDKKFALFSVLLYIVFYVSSGYWMTAQAETFAMLPSLIIFDLTDRTLKSSDQRSITQYATGLYAGVASAIVFLLKFTLLTVPVAAIIYLILERRSGTQSSKKYILGLIVGFVAITGGYLLYLYQTDSLDRFIEALDWVKNYADVDPAFAMHTIIERYFKQFPMLAIYPFGLSGIILAALGIVWYFREKLRPSPSMRPQEHNRNSAMLHLFLQLCLGLCAVLYERKFFPYHFARCYWAFVPFVVLGIRQLRVMWVDYFLSWQRLPMSAKILRYTIACIAVAAIFFFSTAPRLISQPLHFVLLRLSGADLPKDVQDQMPQYYYDEEKKVADYFRNKIKEEDKVFIWGNSIGIYFFLNKYPTTICLTNTPLLSAWTPIDWKNTMLGQLEAAPPKYFIAESGDEREYITASKSDSWQHLKNWSELQIFLEQNYALINELGHFKIFERR
ncbi:MAG: glycosyltransferase family 39 protein [Ignavibacteriota bacterium]